jgi:hypothetical protein
MVFTYPIATYGAEAWIYTAQVKARLCSWYNRKMRTVCGVNLRDGHRSAELREWLGAKDIETLLRVRRLRCQGHTARLPDDRLPKIAMWGTDEFGQAGDRGRASTLRKQWREDLASVGATLGDCADRERWKEIITKDPVPKARAAPHVARAIRIQARGRRRSGRTPLMHAW